MMNNWNLDEMLELLEVMYSPIGEEDPFVGVRLKSGKLEVKSYFETLAGQRKSSFLLGMVVGNFDPLKVGFSIWITVHD